jgi:DNA-binding response OmpR family regulator
MKILLIEDDERIADAIVDELTEHNYVVEVAYDGQLGWEFADSGSYDLIVLDLMLPKIDGITLCRKLRSQGYSIPILMLTGKDTITDRVKGLDAGADDYLVKPFALEEFLARIRALGRRGSSPLPPALTWENLYLDPSTCEVSYQEIPIPLSPTEYRLLELFLRHPQRLFNRSQIIDQLWTFDDPPEETTVKAHIRGLRQKLAKAGVPDIIETVYGLGYRLKQELGSG